jgi:transglutaminase-like putative cysteine protease
VLAAFDSLLDAGRMEEARLLCTGQMLRMFDFLAAAHAKMAGLVDSSRSREDNLEERIGGDWAFVKLASTVVFKRTFLGQDSLRSVQAVHLHRSARGWRIAEMEELERPEDPVRLRSGMPGRAGTGGLFPVSPKAPVRAGEADRLRLRLRRKDGAALAADCPLGPEQSLVRAVSPAEWILETRRVGLSGAKIPPPDSLAPYLASNAYLVLEDSLLAATAARIAGSETDPARITGLVYRWVADSFRFELGSVLFGDSRSILRDLRGDCSEAAILTAALLRSRGIPARIALGFASLGRGVFIGHAWCEAWVGGSWTGVDAALREFPAGAERVKLARLDGKSDMRIAATNLMMRSMAGLDIEIIGAWKNGKSLPLAAHAGSPAEAEDFFRKILSGMEGGAEKREMR